MDAWARLAAAWLGTALAASGLIAASGPDLARGLRNYPPHQAGRRARDPHAGRGDIPGLVPHGRFQQGVPDLPQGLAPEATSTPPPKIIPTMTTTATPPAAQTLVPSTPTVANQGTSQPCWVPAAAPLDLAVPLVYRPRRRARRLPASQTLHPPAGGSPISSPTPEPSTVLSALAMIGAVAWRRRVPRLRA